MRNPDLFAQEMCKKAVAHNKYTLKYIPDCFITQEMCDVVMHVRLAVFFLVPDQSKTYEMCIKALEVDPWQLHDVPDHFKTQDMCDKAVKDDPYSLQFVPDWFVTQQQLKIWHDDDDDYCNDDEMIRWYHGCQKRKAQKAQIKKELMPIAWHPTRWWNWCMSEDEKKETEKL